MAVLIKPIKPKSISDQVFEQIRELIFRGRLKPGEKLMTERELAEAMAVSRTTIRDAIKRLTAIGLVVQRQGQGTFVRSHEQDDNNPLALAMEAQDASILDLYEVRMGLECNAAFLAARRADEDDLKAMRQTIEEMKKEVASGRTGTEADTSFHMAVAFAAKNPLHIFLMRKFYDYLVQGIQESLLCLYEDPGNIEIILAHHKNILGTIESRDPDQAYAAMREHIYFVLNFFRERKEKGIM